MRSKGASLFWLIKTTVENCWLLKRARTGAMFSAVEERREHGKIAATILPERVSGRIVFLGVLLVLRMKLVYKNPRALLKMEGCGQVKGGG